LALLDEEGVCLDINPSFATQMGCRPPFPLAELFPSPFPVSFDLVWTVCRVIGGFRGTLEYSNGETGEGGMVELLLWRRGPIDTGAGYAALLQAATDRVRQERVRGDWQARFERAVRISGDGILDWDLERKRAFFSARFRSILSEEVPTSPTTLASWKQQIAREDRKRVDQSVAQHLRDPHEPFEVEHRLRTSSGIVRYVVLRGQAICDATGKPYRLICSLRDLTEQRDAEARTRQLLADLAHVQRQSTAGELAASIAHELNQPLSAIASFAAGAIRRQENGLAMDDLAALLEKIRRQALRGGEIIRRLRHFVRREPVPYARVDLNDLAREVLELLTPESQDQRISLVADLSHQPLPTLADAIQVQQVMVNLVRNAFDAVAQLNIKRRVVSVKTRPAADDWLEFVVEDQGGGLDPDIINKLGTSLLTTKKDGLGLGLSLSKSILHAHGGELAVWPGKVGTRIGFRLAADPPPSAPR
jgi:C4-dicarboxylate-specific signal transduction histidine kinase